MVKLSECRTCKGNGAAGIQIAFEKIGYKPDGSDKFKPVNPDGSEHQHKQAMSSTTFPSTMNTPQTTTPAGSGIHRDSEPSSSYNLAASPSREGEQIMWNGMTKTEYFKDKDVVNDKWRNDILAQNREIYSAIKTLTTETMKYYELIVRIFESMMTPEAKTSLVQNSMTTADNLKDHTEEEYGGGGSSHEEPENK